jgi:hydroxypyruvate reductase
MDGNSPAAGAMSDGSTVERARRLGLDLRKIRKAANSYELFRRLKDCVVTGPTGNNLRDLYMLLENPTRFFRP